MKIITTKIIGLILGVSLFVSCNAEKSLQVFIVDQQEKSDVIAMDIQTGMLQLDKKLKSKEDLETLKTLKKLSIVAYQTKEGNQARYLAEVKQVKAILKQEKYQELIRFGKGSRGARVYLIGDEDKVDEIIVFANDHSKGWLIVRVLGKNMNPTKMMEVAKKVDYDSSDIDFSIFKNLNIDL